ncbi:hypothetical protein [Brevibacillus laterosporus]|uniref:hypothetical protein n=1 Tax=Brevibacillus laterosporus TaxID=1465 RepID=UPI00215B8479|nr:hypothetical protein [Brevibacillus laterosporus]MCR8994607.1 hypothetical protein [Brevibacillus laterosporus]
MTYEEAKAYKQKLEEKNKDDSAKLKAFGKHSKSAMNLTPDHVKVMPEWEKARRAFDHSFTELRNFNAWFVKTFKKEYVNDRRKRNLTYQ